MAVLDRVDHQRSAAAALRCGSMIAKPLRIGRASASLPSAKTSEKAARAEVRWSVMALKSSSQVVKWVTPNSARSAV